MFATGINAGALSKTYVISDQGGHRSGKSQGNSRLAKSQGKVREFHFGSGKYRIFGPGQGKVREFYNFATVCIDIHIYTNNQSTSSRVVLYIVF